MAQRISRAKAKLRGVARFELPAGRRGPSGCARCCEVLYLLFNEGYTSSQRARPGARSTSRARRSGWPGCCTAPCPDDPEVAGLLALMLLTEARRPARTSADGALVPLAEQDRSLWDRALIGEGLQLLNATLRRGPHRRVPAAGLDRRAPRRGAVARARPAGREIARAYARLESLTGNPMVRLNRAVAVAMVDGPAAGLALLDGLDAALTPTG